PIVAGDPMKDWQQTPPEIREEINVVFSNIGKAIASFQRGLVPTESRVDKFFEARLAGKEITDDFKLTPDEIEGFKLFTGKAKCDNCHSGPLYTDQFFNNTGVPIANPDKPDFGRAAVVLTLKNDPFSCLGKYSDANPDQCRELRFMSDDPEFFEGAFKTPGLRNVSKRPPYMHAGQIGTLEEVINHYVNRPDPFSTLPEILAKYKDHGDHTAVPKINLNEEEKSQLLAFLKAL
ncbi:MAG: methylamine utilization protein, partial [Salaquimonas sp.]